MPARLDPRPLIDGLLDGLRKRRQIGIEPVDRVTRLFLFGVPIASAICCWAAGVKLQGAEQLIAGLAILVGALLATFTQLASWRERLSARAKKVDGVRMRALDEAVAHVLLGVTTAALTAAALIVIASDPYAWLHIALSGLAVAAMTNLLVTLLVVTNLLWDAYRGANPASTTVSKPGDDSERPRRSA